MASVVMQIRADQWALIKYSFGIVLTLELIALGLVPRWRLQGTMVHAVLSFNPLSPYVANMVVCCRLPCHHFSAFLAIWLASSFCRKLIYIHYPFVLVISRHMARQSLSGSLAASVTTHEHNPRAFWCCGGLRCATAPASGSPPTSPSGGGGLSGPSHRSVSRLAARHRGGWD